MKLRDEDKRETRLVVMVNEREREVIDAAAKLERVSRSALMGKASLDEARRIITEARKEAEEMASVGPTR